MKKYLIILMCFLVSLLFIFFFILKVDRKLTNIEVVIKEPVLYVEKIVEVPFNYVKDKLNILKSKNKLVNDLSKLKKVKEENAFLNNELKEKNRKLSELSNLVNINASFNYNLINSNIIVRNVGYWYQVLTLDKGSNDEILKNSMVINKDGLIGIVDKVSKHTSSVKLITSVCDDFKIGVLIDNNGDTVYGILSDFKNGLFEVRGISYNKEIKLDSIVTTSGLDNGLISGINVGKVEKIKKDNFDLEQIVYVKPSVNFNSINYASIVVVK